MFIDLLKLFLSRLTIDNHCRRCKPTTIDTPCERIVTKKRPAGALLDDDGSTTDLICQACEHRDECILRIKYTVQSMTFFLFFLRPCQHNEGYRRSVTD